MAVKLAVGDPVTVRPPYTNDPILVEMQHHARIAKVLDGGEYMIALGSAWPPNKEFGPFPAWRLDPGWR